MQYRTVKASEQMPELYPVNATSELHFELDGRKVDGFFLHSRCFEYFDNTISGYRQLEVEDFGRITWLEEAPDSEVDRLREAIENIQQHIDMWFDEPERAMRLVQKEVGRISPSKPNQ